MLIRRSRHVCTNLDIERVDAEHAMGRVYQSLNRHDFGGDERSEGGGAWRPFRITEQALEELVQPRADGSMRIAVEWVG